MPLLSKKHSDNSKQLWKRFGNVLGKSKSKQSSIEKLLIDNYYITEQKTITTEFNKYFCSGGEPSQQNKRYQY